MISLSLTLSARAAPISLLQPLSASGLLVVALLAVTYLHERFDAPLTFGTAGLRGVVGAGPAAMNRLVVRRTAAGVADWVRAKLLSMGCLA